MHLSIELQAAIVRIKGVASETLELMTNPHPRRGTRVTTDDLFALMEAGATVYHAARAQIDETPPVPRLRLVPTDKSADERAERDRALETGTPDPTAAPAADPSPSKPRRPRP